MFNELRDSMVVVEKKQPEWQAGLLNGPGGKVNQESPDLAMTREFFEETGVINFNWDLYHQISVGEDSVYFFRSFVADPDFYQVQTMTEEEISILKLDVLLNLDYLVPNLYWLIPMAMDLNIRLGSTYYRDE